MVPTIKIFFFKMAIISLHFYGSVSFERRYTESKLKNEYKKRKMNIRTTSNDEKQKWKTSECFVCFRLLHFSVQQASVFMFIVGAKLYSFALCTCISSMFALEKFKWISNGVLTSSLSLYERKADLLLWFSTVVYSFCVCVCVRVYLFREFTEHSDCCVTTTTM